MADPAIDKKWKDLGGSGSVLGAPSGDAFPAGPFMFPPVDGPRQGWGRKYQHGFIYHRLPHGPTASAVHEVHGAILAKWNKLGRSGNDLGFLGFPLSDEIDTKGTAGRWNRFEHGTITWKKGASEAFEVHGAILNKWSALGGSASDIGLPITDETTTPDTVGRFNHFERGSIYWKPSLGAHVVWGLIRGLWAKNGWERNAMLGYPITDEKASSKGRFTDFENGVLYWRSGDDKAVELSAFGLGGASRSAAEVNEAITTAIATRIKAMGKDVPKGVSGVAITKFPKPLWNPMNAAAGRAPWVSDYRADANRVVNRRLSYYLEFALVISGSNDIDVKLTLDIELFKQGQNIMFRIDHFHFKVEVDFPTTCGADADEIAAQLKARFNAVPAAVVGTIPGVKLLSVKVQPDGSLDSYIEPVV